MELVQVQHTEEYGPQNAFPPYFHNLKASSNSPLHVASEWGGDYDQDLPLKSKSSATAVETPLKKVAAVHLITPGKSNNSPAQSPMLKLGTSTADLAAPSPPPETKVGRKVQPTDVLWAMLNDIVGKDKMAKFGQYTLRLLLYHSQKTQDWLSDELVNIKLINKTYARTEHIMDLVMNFLQNPQGFARVLIILICSVFNLRFAAVVPALGMYRQFLRFGKSPFRIRNLYNKIRDSVDTSSTKWKISPSIFSNTTLGEVISLYYSLNDESILMSKVGLIQNPTVKNFVSKHEAYAWYCESWYALYNAYVNLQHLRQQEMDVKIQIQVKKRARAISKQLLGGGSVHNPIPSLSSSNLDDDSKDNLALKEIMFKKTNANIDIYKTLSDIVFNSYTVWGMALHFDTIQIWMGISASFLSSVKLYREKKKELVSKCKT